MINNTPKKKICFIVSVYITVDSFLKNHINELSKYYEIYLVGNFKIEDLGQLENLNIKSYKIIPLERKIHLINDVKSLLMLMSYFKKNNFYAVHSVTPKAGLITSIAGFFLQIKNRIHIFTGQVWITKKGLLRILLIFFDWLIGHLNTLILVDGKSQKDFLTKHKIIKKNNSFVLGEGSIAGVNTELFHPTIDTRNEIRNKLKIFSNQIVFVFLGRLNKDKGINELLFAFNKLVLDYNNAFLLLIGIDEENLLLKISDFSNIEPNKNFLFYGKTQNPEILLQAGDVFCLPTYREGFGLSVIEASCLGLPVICSDTYGVMDAMVENVTGLRCKVKDVDSLLNAMVILYKDESLRNTFGENGRKRVLSKFSGVYLTDKWVEFYKKI